MAKLSSLKVWASTTEYTIIHSPKGLFYHNEDFPFQDSILLERDGEVVSEWAVDSTACDCVDGHESSYQLFCEILPQQAVEHFWNWFEVNFST